MEAFRLSWPTESNQISAARTPDSYYLVDVSLLYDDGQNDGLELAAETQFFKDNWQLGKLVSWPTYGSLRCYFHTGSSEQDRLLKTFDEWLPDKLIQRTETLRYMLETSWLPTPTPFDPQYDPPPIVFYVHCDGGCDRTGEMIGAYRLRQGYSWWDMWAEHPCNRPMGCNNHRALEWYAYWLKLMVGFNLPGVGDDGGCSDRQGPWNPCVALADQVNRSGAAPRRV
jgi:hypothetical protein